MKRILVVFTGGTIGCRVDDLLIDVDKEKPFYLLKLFNEKYDMVCDMKNQGEIYADDKLIYRNGKFL